jgi:hypothetical protein
MLKGIVSEILEYDYQSVMQYGYKHAIYALALENSVIHVGRAAQSMWMTDFSDLSTWMTEFSVTRMLYS